MKLYTYYRSQASFRVRIALNLKGIARDDSYLHLEKGDQFVAEYRALNPQMMVPTLIDDGVEAIEARLAEHLESGDFCHGERPSIADICLVTQVTPAKTFDCPLASYPRIMRIYDTCMAIPAFSDAHPTR
jgi:glutathione S-transferase